MRSRSDVASPCMRSSSTLGDADNTSRPPSDVPAPPPSPVSDNVAVQRGRGRAGSAAQRPHAQQQNMPAARTRTVSEPRRRCQLAPCATKGTDDVNNVQSAAQRSRDAPEIHARRNEPLDSDENILEELADMRFDDKTPAYVRVRIKELQDDNVVLTACADTGSSLSLIDENLYRRYFGMVATRPCQLTTLCGISGNTVITKYVVLSVYFDDTQGKRVTLPVKLYVNPSGGRVSYWAMISCILRRIGEHY